MDIGIPRVVHDGVHKILYVYTFSSMIILIKSKDSFYQDGF